MKRCLPLLCSATAALSATAPYPSSAHPTGAKPLKVISTAGLAAGDVVTIETLSGGLARDTPEVYRVADSPTSADSYSLWLREMTEHHGVKTDLTHLNNLTGLLEAFRPRIRGYVRFTAATASVNAALTYCAAQSTEAGVVVAVSEPATLSLMEAMKVPAVADLRSSTAGAVYDAHRDAYSHRGVSFQPPSKSGCLGGYATFARMPTVEWEGNDGGAAAQDMMADVKRAGTCGVAMGWGPEERYVAKVASYDAFVHASDYAKDVAALSNLAAHAGVKRKPLRPRRKSAPPQPPSAAAHTVTFLVTDGDNLQWMLGSWATADTWFGSPDLGKVPVGFTVSPALATVAPVVLEYAHRVAAQKGNTSFVAGPSGLGYTFPEDLSSAALADFAGLTSSYLPKAGLDIVNVIGHSDSPSVLTPLLNGSAAVFYYSFGDYYVGEAGRVQWVGRKPIIGGRYALWGESKQGPAMGVDGLVAALAKLPKDPSSTDGYSLIPVHAWTHSVADIVAAVDKLRSMGGFDVVTPDDFVERMVAGVAPADCPTPTGSFSASCSACSTDPHTCVMKCSCRAGTGAREASCNLQCCSDLANTDGHLTCGGNDCPISC